MVERPNIVWFLVDSIRAYRTDSDLRGKLPVMERFAPQSVEFSTCVTTAPSTVMSITAMMTGLPAYFLARNYEDFRFDSRSYRCLTSELRKHGYSSFAFLRGPETREKFQHLLATVPRELWLPHLRHRRKWTNEDLNLLLERALQIGISRPAFLFFHYNPQTRSEKRELIVDPAVSKRVEDAWKRLAEAGFSEDNTIYVLCSDHGFPDPKTGMTSDWEAKHRLSHDLVLTDDNILVPLYIRYPGCKPRRVTTPVSSLDLFPTLLDLAGLPDVEEIKGGIDGRSLVPLMEGIDRASYAGRCLRSDSRLMLQGGRSTAIRNSDFKYIRYHDGYRFAEGGESQASAEVLVDLRSDPAEERNLLLSEPLSPELRRVLEKFRAEFDRTESRALEFQIRYLLSRQEGRPLSDLNALEELRTVLLVFEPGAAAFEEIGLGAMARACPGAAIDVFADGSDSSEGARPKRRRRFRYSWNRDGKIKLPEVTKNSGLQAYDLVILFVQNPAAPQVSELLKVLRSQRCKHHLVVDCNFNTYRRRNYSYYLLRSFLASVPYMIDEPALLLSRAKLAVGILFRGAMRRLGMWERWGGIKPSRSPKSE